MLNNDTEHPLDPSDFYWESLGIPNYHIAKLSVTNRVNDFGNFISRAISSLERFTFRYTFSAFSKFKISPKDLYGMQGEITLCTDPKCTGVIFKGKLNENQKWMTTLGIHNFSEIYVKGTAKKINVGAKMLILREIRPKNVNEDEENAALDSLFEASDIFHGRRSKANRLSIIRKNRNRVELTIEYPESQIKLDEDLIVAFNTYPLSRQKAALHKLIEKPQINMMPIINLLQQKRFVEWPSIEDGRPYRYGVLTNEMSPGTLEQREFVKKALGTSDFAILEGPPGSGKTSTLLEIILNLCLGGKRVLMVASTHVAVDNILERLSEETHEKDSLMDKFGIIPLRIGEEENVSERVRRFIISRRKAEEKRRLLSFLGTRKSPSEAQKLLFSALEQDGGDETIEKLIMDSSNFICGTTIGILKSKLIQQSDRSTESCPFDYMILDEASKTTFTEFLVPALYAKRWIISGDPRQLSPYVDQEFIRNVVSALPSFWRRTDKEKKSLKNVALDVFNAANDRNIKSNAGALVIDDGTNREGYEVQSKIINNIMKKRNDHEIAQFDLSEVDTKNDRLKIIGSRMIFGKINEVEKYWSLIPPTLSLRGDAPSIVERRRAGFLDLNEQYFEAPSWESEVSWRMNRAYEMRGDSKAKRLIEELEMLTPYFLDGSRKDDTFKLSIGVRSDLRRIRRTFYPSIIEMLQYGVNETKREDETESIALYEGIPEETFNNRHTLLTYQHRMHPEISMYARRLFYEDKALLDAPDLSRSRRWGYDKRYKRRMIWIDKKTRKFNSYLSDTNVNELEVEIIKDELTIFLSWAQNNPKHDRNLWKVALLTFYRGQEKALSKMMQHLTGLNNHRYFSLNSRNVEVEVCTVDRFQGQEADLVFLSMVRRKGVGFLDNRNRMNVAITRARFQMVIVGDKTPFRRAKVEFLRRMSDEIEGPI